MRSLVVACSFILLILSGCKTKEHIVYENHVVYFHDTTNVSMVDTVVVNNEIHLLDSILVKDSSSVSLDEYGNKVKEVWHWRYQYKDESERYSELESKYESLKQRKDSVITETITNTVVEKVSTIDKIKIGFQSIAIVAVFALFLWVLVRLKNYVKGNNWH